MQHRYLLLLPALLALPSCGRESPDPSRPDIPLEPARAVVGDIRSLGTLGGPGSTAFSVNEHGDVVGVSASPDGVMHGFLWSEAGGLVDLGPGAALRINDRGQVLFNKFGGFHLWTREGGFVYTGLASSYSPNDLNERGHLAGRTPDDRAFFWTPESGPVLLSGLGHGWSEAVAMNDEDEIAGFAATEAIRGPFLWSPEAGVSPIDGYPGAVMSRPIDLNNRGQVVCTAFLSSGIAPYRAYLWSRDGGMVDLGTGTPGAINDLGQVVGTAVQKNGGWSYAFYWEPETGLISLRWLVPRPLGSHAYDLNGRGDVVGTSSWFEPGKRSGRTSATLWKMRTPGAAF